MGLYYGGGPIGADISVTDSSQATPPPAESGSDEISLRDLYLILRRGLPVILLLATVAAALAYAYTSWQQPLYEAESTTIITPPPLNIQGEESIIFLPPATVTFEAYETLALSRPVFEGALARLPDVTMSVSELRGASRLERLLGPQRPDQVTPLSMSHHVRHADPGLSAALTNAWAESTLSTIRDSLLAGLGPVDEATGQEVAALRARLGEAEAAWETFQQDNALGLLEARLTRLTTAIAEAELGLVTLPEASAPTTSLQLGEATLRQSAAQVNLEAEIAATRAELGSLPNETGESEALRARRLSLQARLAGLEARQALLQDQLEGYYGELAGIRTEAAASARRQDTLLRDRDNARAAYQTVVQLQPSIAYVTQLAPLSARVLSEASVPESTVGPRPLLNAVLASLVAASLATLVAFLREAVAGPVPPQVARARPPPKPAPKPGTSMREINQRGEHE